MSYYNIPGKSTVVYAFGQADNGRYRKTETMIYYMSFAGPPEAAKAIWAHAVGSKKTGRVETSYWRSGSLAKPNRRCVGRLKTTNHVHYIMRVDDPSFLMVIDPMLNVVGLHTSGFVSQRKNLKAYTAIKALLPDWEPGSEEDYGYTVLDWMRQHPKVQEQMAAKLVNALNEATKVPVLPEWGPTLLKMLPADAKMDLDTHGDVAMAIMLNPAFKWQEWIGSLIRKDYIRIPPKNKE